MAKKPTYEELEQRVKELEIEMGGADYPINTITDITELKQAQEELRKSKEFYALILASTHDAIWDWDVPNHRVVFSQRWKEMRGFAENAVSEDEKEWSSSIHPDDLDRVMAAVQNHFRMKTEFFEEEYRIYTKDGSVKWILDRGIAQHDDAGNVVRMVGAESDITERKQAEEALRKSEEKYRTLLENAGEAVLVAQDGVFKFGNPKAEELFGYSKEELASKPFTYFIHEEDREMVRERHEKRIKGEMLPEVYPYRIIDKNGQCKWVELKVVLFSWEERPATLCFMMDISDRKRAEEVLLEYRKAVEGSEELITAVD